MQICFALRLYKIDEKHLLANQLNCFYYTNQKCIIFRRFDKMIFKAPKPTLSQSHYSNNNCKNFIKKVNKETLIKAFTK